MLILGSPGKVVRELKAEEIAGIRDIALRYAESGQRYRREMQPQDIPG